MWLFSKTYQLAETGLLPLFTDLHSHLLFGVDDGVEEAAEAREIMRRLKALGIQRSFLTPHIMGDLYNNSAAQLTAHFTRNFLPIAKQEEFEVRLAAEYMLDDRFLTHLSGAEKPLTYDGVHLLVELSYQAPAIAFENLIFEIQCKGYTPVLAHPERYSYYTQHDLKVIKDRGVKLQLNLMSLTDKYGRHAYETAHKLLDAQLYDFVGTDIHRINMCEKIEKIQLKKKEVREVRRLMENNNLLWKTDFI